MFKFIIILTLLGNVQNIFAQWDWKDYWFSYDRKTDLYQVYRSNNKFQEKLTINVNVTEDSIALENGTVIDGVRLYNIRRHFFLQNSRVPKAELNKTSLYNYLSYTPDSPNKPAYITVEKYSVELLNNRQPEICKLYRMVYYYSKEGQAYWIAYDNLIPINFNEYYLLTISISDNDEIVQKTIKMKNSAKMEYVETEILKDADMAKSLGMKILLKNYNYSSYKLFFKERFKELVDFYTETMLEFRSKSGIRYKTFPIEVTAKNGAITIKFIARLYENIYDAVPITKSMK